MKKILLFISSILICSTLLASEKEDIKFLDALFIQKKYSMALKESNNFINKYPKSQYVKSIRIKMGQVYYVEGEYSKAINILTSCLNEKKLSTEEKNSIYLYLVKSFVAIDDFVEAKKLTTNIERVTPEGQNDYEEALISIAKGYMRNKEFIQAEEELKKALKIHGENYEEVVINLALSAYNNGEYTKTISYLNEYYRGNKVGRNIDIVNYIYGSSYYKTKNDKNALIYFQKVTNKSSYYNLSNLAMIEIYLKMNNFKEAEQKLLELKKDPILYQTALKSFGDFYLLKGENSKALEYYQKIAKKDNDVIYGIALAEYNLKRYDSSLKNFKQLYTTKYKSESIYYQITIEFINKNYKWILENKNLVDGIELSKEEEVAINNMIGASAFEEKNYNLALQYYQKNNEIKPSKDIFYKLIVVINKIEEPDEILSLIKNYNRKYPMDLENKKNLTIIAADNHLKKGEGVEAIWLYKEYLTKENDSEILDSLIEALISEKKYKDAKEYLSLQENSPENTYLKGIVEMGMGNYEQALNFFQENLKEENKIPQDIKEKTSYNIIKNYFLWGNSQEVIKSGEEYVAGDNLYNLEDVVDKIAISYYREDNLEKSREYFNKLKTIPEFKDYAEFQIAETYYNEKNYPKAVEWYRKSANDSTSIEYREKGLYWEISSLYLDGNLKEFKEKSEQFIENYPNSKLRDNVILMQGESYSSIGKEKDTIKSYEKLYNETKDEALKEKSITKILEILQSGKDVNKELDWINKITDEEKKSYYMAKHLKRQNKVEEARLELEKLTNSPDYKDYAAIELGDYYFDKKDYQKASPYYIEIINMKSSLYTDKALYQIANIQKNTGDINESITNYTKLYILYPTSQYALESKIRAAEGYEINENYSDAISQYKELLETDSKNKEYFIEKLIFLNLKIDNKKEAETYYKKLEKQNLEISKKYKDFFYEGENK